MAQDFTATVLDEVRLNLEEAFLDSRIDLPLKSTPISMLAMFERQTARASALLDESAQECVGYKVEYLKNDSNALPTVDATAGGFACEIPLGATLDSATKTYDLNVFITETFSVSDNDCDNSMKFARKAAKATAAAMQKICLSLNDYLITELVANAQTPSYPGESGTIVGNTIEYPAANFKGDLATETVGEFYEIAQVEKIAPSYFVLNGKNFNVAQIVSQFTAADDDKRSRAVALRFGDKMEFDINNLDTSAGSDSSFIVDNNMYVCAFNNAYTPEMQPLADDVQVFTLPLTYYDQFTGRVEQVMLYDGAREEMVPVLVDVEYQQKCDANSKNRTRKTLHTFRATLRGLFNFAPGDGGSTGVIQVVKV